MVSGYQSFKIYYLPSTSNKIIDWPIKYSSKNNSGIRYKEKILH